MRGRSIGIVLALLTVPAGCASTATLSRPTGRTATTLGPAVPPTVSEMARQFQTAARTLNPAIDQAQREVANASTIGALVNPCELYAEALARFDYVLSHMGASGQMKADINRLVNDNVSTIDILASVGHQTTGTFSTWAATFSEDSGQAKRATAIVQNDLGLAPTG